MAAAEKIERGGLPLRLASNAVTGRRISSVYMGTKAYYELTYPDFSERSLVVQEWGSTFAEALFRSTGETPTSQANIAAQLVQRPVDRHLVGSA
jgi:hypothetical protein